MVRLRMLREFLEAWKWMRSLHWMNNFLIESFPIKASVRQTVEDGRVILLLMNQFSDENGAFIKWNSISRPISTRGNFIPTAAFRFETQLIPYWTLYLLQHMSDILISIAQIEKTTTTIREEKFFCSLHLKSTKDIFVDCCSIKHSKRREKRKKFVDNKRRRKALFIWSNLKETQKALKQRHK